MFHLIAFTSTVLVVTLLAIIYTGGLFYVQHTLPAARYTGLVVAVLAFAALVSHLVALIVGA